MSIQFYICQIFINEKSTSYFHSGFYPNPFFNVLNCFKNKEVKVLAQISSKKSLDYQL